MTAVQRETLAAFFEREHDFFLTGGAALAGYYLGHRATDDLDLFTLDDEAFVRGARVLIDVAHALGGTLEVRQDTPRFKRFVLMLRDEGVVVDLVRDVSPQLHGAKVQRDGITLDPPDEILANKLTALVGRAEERDLIDLLFLERAGHSIESGLDAALRKDGGCTPATLAWLLSQIEIPEELALPGDITALELRTYVASLVVRLRRLALPAR